MSLCKEQQITLSGETQKSGVITRIVELVALDNPAAQWDENFPPQPFSEMLTEGKDVLSIPNEYDKDDTIYFQEISNAYPDVDSSKVYLRVRWEFVPDA